MFRIALLSAWLGIAALAQAQDFQVEAFHGSPLGVVCISQRMRDPIQTLQWDDHFDIRDQDGRVRYPVLRNRTRAAGEEHYVREYSFLFTGQDPLTIEALNGDAVQLKVTPQADPAGHKKLIAKWWEARQHRRTVTNQWQGPPQLVTSYVDTMLARRFQLYEKQQHDFGSWNEGQLIGFFLGTESIRMAAAEQTKLKPGQAVAPADVPLPKGVDIPAVKLPPIPENVVIEPIARHVPAECFYLRCGSYENFSWLRRTLDQWGGNLREIIVRHHVDYRIQERLERQLVLKETALAKTFGNLVIADIAVIGTDTFVREGSAMGVLFQSKQGKLLPQVLEQQRRAAKEADTEIVESKVEIGGHTVSLLSTPNHQVRSFLAVDGAFCFVTNSSELVRRFYEAGAGQGCLADLDEFKYARSQHNALHPAAAFLHLSDNFFRNLLSPQYRIEMTRRLASDIELETIELAQCAARSEGAKFDTIEDLRNGSYLPPGPEQRSDGSQSVPCDSVEGRDGGATTRRWKDSRRGTRGSFLPIPDMQVTHATSQEARAYEGFRSEYARVWTRVDPVTINITRRAVDRNSLPTEQKESLKEAAQRERVVFDIYICPVAAQHYGFLQGFLKPATTQRFKRIPGAIVDLQALPIFGGPSANTPDTAGNTRVGVLDENVDYQFNNGQVHAYDHISSPRAQKLPPWYWMCLLNEQTRGALDKIKLSADGYYQNIYQLFFHLRWGKVTQDQEVNVIVASDRKDVVDQVFPTAGIEHAERPAQVRLQVADLKASKMFPFFRAQSYSRDVRTSFGSTYLLNELTQQFGVKPTEAAQVLNRTLDGELQCALGGELKYELDAPTGRQWRSTAFPSGKPTSVHAVAKDYRSQLLDWWHGLDLEFTLKDQTLRVRAEMELQP